MFALTRNVTGGPQVLEVVLVPVLETGAARTESKKREIRVVTLLTEQSLRCAPNEAAVCCGGGLNVMEGLVVLRWLLLFAVVVDVGCWRGGELHWLC